MNKKSIVAIITFFGGLFFLLEFLLPAKAPAWLGGFENPFTTHFNAVNSFLMVLGAMAFYLGPLNLVRSEVKTLVRRGKGWLESAAFLVALAVSVAAAAGRSDAPATGFARAMTLAYDALFYGVSLAFYITSMGLVSFYLVSAAHRAFRLNSVESALMMISASIVMLGLTPAGDYLTQQLPNWFAIGPITQWILNGPNAAVQKAVLFGAAGGAFVAAVRNWLSLGGTSE
jgi:hypothetical protein